MGRKYDNPKEVDMEAVEDFKQDKVANIPNSLLISASYNGKTKKVSLKFYDPESEKIYLWEDKTGHRPYCFSKMAPEDLEFLSERDDVIEIKTVKKNRYVERQRNSSFKNYRDRPTSNRRDTNYTEH